MSDFFNRISNYKYPYIIAEIGANHNGDMDIAKKSEKKEFAQPSQYTAF